MEADITMWRRLWLAEPITKIIPASPYTSTATTEKSYGCSSVNVMALKDNNLIPNWQLQTQFQPELRFGDICKRLSDISLLWI